MPISIIILGGGAAGLFASLSAKEANPLASVYLLEKSNTLLSKVKVSGGGRCNVTHHCFDPKELIRHYPRGGKELLGPFHRFQPKDTVEWFESRGVNLKTEQDGRIFPITDTSQTIIDCLLEEANRLKVLIQKMQKVENVGKIEGGFELTLEEGKIMRCNRLLLATGSSPSGYRIAESFGHSIQKPVPSLFTFNIPASPFLDLSGITIEKARLQLHGTNLVQTGQLLLTHWGFSGPAALKLSAWGARALQQHQYHMELIVDWIPEIHQEQVVEALFKLRTTSPQQLLSSKAQFSLPKNLWKRLLVLAGIDEGKRLAEISNDTLFMLTSLLKAQKLQIEGKTTHKEEFVTCGGVTLTEINFKTFESKLCPGLYFAGEVMDIDAVTGGFNFQNAWTSGWIAGQAICQ